MINTVYRLIAPKLIQAVLVDEVMGDDHVVIKPQYLSICAADQRYFRGLRPPEALAQKLPMALIHEAVGKVVYDPKGIIEKGTSVVLIPNTITHENKKIKENYQEDAYFRSSGHDGFMQDLVVIDRNRILDVQGIPLKVASMIELLSVVFNAIASFEAANTITQETLGVWGSGNLGYLLCMVLKYKYPKAKVIIFGRENEKLNYFQFADERYTINSVPKDLRIDHGFECVGGTNSGNAIDQMIDLVYPQGTLTLLGVSEDKVLINTRMVLEKGITLIGSSRSGYDDFVASIEFLHHSKRHVVTMSRLISNVISVNDIDDIHRAFKEDLINDFKTIMEWNI